MNNSGTSSYKYMLLGLAVILIAGGVFAGSFREAHTQVVDAASAQPPTVPALAADDVSILFPFPRQPEDFAKLIAVRDLIVPNAQDLTKHNLVWPSAAFSQLLSIAAGPAAQVNGTQIGLPPEAKTIDGWFISGIRIDAGAPGLSNDIRAQFGQSPEIRLIIQPVKRDANGIPVVDDIAVHLIFDFRTTTLSGPAQTGCLPEPNPDLAAFSAIVGDLVDMRTRLASGQLGNKVVTAGRPLGVHPALADATTELNFRNEIVAFLERHISGDRLNAMAIAGVPAGAPAPWIFLSMAKAPSGSFVPVPSPTLDGGQFAQMLLPLGTVQRVVPVPHTNNLNPITCLNAAAPAGLPIVKRTGVATADLFTSPPPSSDKAKQTLDIIADPSKSHFFNTDCASCHTETRRAMELMQGATFPGIDPAALPHGLWDVRNFGWSPDDNQATVTRRTATETAAVVSFVNTQLLMKPQQ